MAYATPQDMVTRFGQSEMLRLTVQDGLPLDVIDLDALGVALADASSIIDSYARRRYLTPVAPTPQEFARACCILARYDLAHGDGTNPTVQMESARRDVITWLEKLRDGLVLLADATPAGGQSFGQVQDAGCAVFRDASQPGVGWPTPDDFWSAV